MTNDVTSDLNEGIKIIHNLKTQHKTREGGGEGEEEEEERKRGERDSGE